jgi:two-component sensor histidine kinase
VKIWRRVNAGYNQLRWVILLLAIAVILPTVCLLWFMTQAVKNDRLAVRQRLIDSYTSRAQKKFFKDPEIAIEDPNEFSASIIYDQNDKIIYPVRTNQALNSPAYDIEKAWKLEYVDKNYDEAIKQYDSISIFSSIIEITYDCKISVVRCLIKQNKTTEAIEKCRQLLYPAPNTLPIPPIYAAYARLMLTDLYSKVNHTDMIKELQNQLTDTSESGIPTETQVFVLEELIKLAKKSALADKLNTEIQTAKKIIDSASLSIIATDYFDADKAAQDKPDKTFYKILSTPPLYCIKFKNEDKKTVNMLTTEKMKQLWQKSVDDFTDELVFCRIYDDKGEQIAGEPRMYAGAELVFGNVFATLNLQNYFNGFKVELYLRMGVFKETADKKKFVYLWIAFTVIILMLSSTLLAGKAVLRQAKLNRLKNDFIATVTHELKTPLSSMRVLVDTLLEGNYNDQQQATEYLQLISKENVRLSRLIDNFLTFSRMERNKQAFDMAKTNPAEIAKAAAEAVHTKFNHENCKFIVTIDDNLPSIIADKDAIVTVLINLLDNAYKYSYDNKRIKLRVFSEDSYICFSVTDNGIGIGQNNCRQQTRQRK